MNTRILETNAFKVEIPHYYQTKDFDSMKSFIDALVMDTFDSGIDLSLKDILRPASKENFLAWVNDEYPEYEMWLVSNSNLKPY